MVFYSTGDEKSFLSFSKSRFVSHDWHYKVESRLDKLPYSTKWEKVKGDIAPYTFKDIENRLFYVEEEEEILGRDCKEIKKELLQPKGFHFPVNK